MLVSMLNKNLGTSTPTTDLILEDLGRNIAAEAWH